MNLPSLAFSDGATFSLFPRCQCAPHMSVRAERKSPSSFNQVLTKHKNEANEYNLHFCLEFKFKSYSDR